MRVVHLATVDVEGGAARAAFRLHKGLVEAGADSAMLVRKKVSPVDSVRLAPGLEPEDSFFWNLIEKFYLEARRTPISNTYFSIGYPGPDLTEHPLIQSADVVHLHWVAGFQSSVSIARLGTLGKPLVWTVHDQRPFTGGCHFSAGCTGYQKDCAGCPQLQEDSFEVPAANLADQLQLLPVDAITVVAPSRWLADCARRSALFSRSRVETIPYGIETDCFQPQPREATRQRLGLPASGFQLLLGADYGSEKRKGFLELMAALQLCLNERLFQQRLQRGEVSLLAFGRPNPELNRLTIPVKYFGYVDSDKTLASIYAAANLFILPSLEDNLPNTVLESMSCGTPALAFNVGGLPDLITDGVTGRLVPAGNIPELSAALLSLIANAQECERWGSHCRQQIMKEFSLGAQARRYLDLYEKLTSKSEVQSPKSKVQSAESSVRDGFDKIGPRMQSIYLRVLLDALERFEGTMKRATGAERRLCRELIRSLRTASAAGLSGEATQKIARLKTEFIAAEAQRQRRLTEYRQRKATRRKPLSNLFKAFGLGSD